VSSDDGGDGECLLEKLMEVDCWVPCGGKGHWAVATVVDSDLQW